MNTITTIFVAALCFGGAFASPIAQQESRTILDTDNGLYLGLNSTTLVIGLVLVAGLLVGVILLQGSGLLEGVSQQKRYDQYYPNEHHQHHHHTKRSFDGKFKLMETNDQPLSAIIQFSMLVISIPWYCT